ncbi:DUF3631 domain-containing protein [Myceligenerans salitolerans]|uniref:DUF3631 domain-containing protein n=1 Tax=Myceligenerans salitolerans TaxID=1230528 RepID=A0ABS3I8P4_9MICO|nr:DUF3631 domain-containing protein [Myceligenerans salitolerans]MBO0609379.1 DUF3631 domain-containing protein [Myceligenerans salitolerans]
MTIKHTTPAETGAGLLDDVRDTVARWARLDQDDAGAVALWVAATHAPECWAHAPRLLVNAERGGWRSKLMGALAGLVHKPMTTATAAPLAVLRAVDARGGLDDPPTLLVHDWPPQWRRMELWALLGGGFHREAHTLTYDAAEGTVRRLSNYAMAAIFGPVPDYVTDQGVTVTLRATAPAGYRPRNRPGWHVLTDLHHRLNAWTDDQHLRLMTAIPVSPVTDRDADVWAPLLTVADTAGGHWPTTARALATAHAAKEDRR